MLALLHAMQNVCPKARISTIHRDSNIKEICTKDDIPHDEALGKDYIFEGKIISHTFQVQMVIKSNIPLKDTREHLLFHLWASNDQIVLSKQHHTRTKYIDIGFYSQVLNQIPMDMHHTASLQK